MPLLNRVSHLSLREAIAATSAVMCVTALVGAVHKNMALPSLGLDAFDSLVVATCLAPTAMVGALLGARLTHVLPLVWVRAAFIVLVAWGGVEMLEIL